MGSSPTYAVGAALAVTGILASAACDWDAFDPRLRAPAVGGSGGTIAATGGSDAGGAGGQGGATTGAGAGAPVDCGRISMVTDPFDGDGFDPVKWYEGGNGSGRVVEVVNGELRLTFGAASTSSYAHLTSRYFYDMREGSVAAEVLQVIDPASDDATELYVERDGGHRATIRVRGSMLQALRTRSGITDLIADIPYNATTHRWWRLRHSAGQVYFEFSTDGGSWGTLAKISDKYVHDFSHSQVWLRSDAQGSVAPSMMAQTAIIGQVVAAVEPGAPDGDAWCKADRFTDGFDTEDRDFGWLRSRGDSGSFAFQSDGEVYLGLDWDDAGPFYEYRSARAYDLSDSAIGVEMVAPAEAPPGRTYLEAMVEGEDDRIVIGMQAREDMDTMMPVQEMTCTWRDDGVDSEVCPNVTYDPSQHRFIRIREEGGTLFWEASGDGTTYNELGRLQQHPFDLSGIWTRFGASTNTQVVVPPPEVRFDNYNRPP